MSEINLRTYIHEIDSLIEEGQQLEEAIAHCRHVLKTYPKHIDTYRLLGKAYLEAKRFGDAGDIFQRVLSAIPHDFVSHVGMAIIREDEGNLDAAIWHMERSAESQPGNAAIEEELKRLIGKSDGIEPQRVRPTRGALARMYYHGELYSYAASELQKALEEDPDRPDLQLLLADTYWRTDQRREAADLCSQILEKLPHCFLANQITSALLQVSGKAQEAAINLRRLIALDPYMAFIDSPMDNPDTVESNAVQLEKLSWKPGQPLPSAESTQPDWAASLGVDLRDEQAKTADQEAMPSWLQSPPASEEMMTPEEESTIHPFAGAKPPPGAEIPEWMRDAGWVESSGEATEGPVEFDQTPEEEIKQPVSDQPLEPADLPGWLSEITTDETPQAEPSPKTPVSEVTAPETDLTPQMEDDQELPDWIQDISSETPEAEPEIADFPFEEEPEIVTPSPPTDEMKPDLTGEAVEELPEFLSEDEAPEEEEIPEYPPWLEPSTPGATDTIVSWLGDKSLEEVAASEDIPTWMRGTGPLDEAAIQDYKPTDSPDEPLAEPPPSFEEISSVSSDHPEPVSEDEAPPRDIPMDEAAPEWLDEISELEDEIPTPDSVQPEEAPDWLKDSTVEDEEKLVLEEAEAPTWLADLDEEEVGEAVAEEIEETIAEPEEISEAVEEPPDWLSEVIQDEILEDDEQEVKPEWLEGIEEAEIIPQEEVLDLEDAPDWLTEMSMVEEVDTSPEAEEEEPPEWLKGLAEIEVSPETEQPSEPETLPEWVTEESFPETEEEIITEEETPEWLQEISDESVEVEEPSDIPVEPSLAEETPPEGEKPDWLQDLRDAAPDEAVSDEIEQELPAPEPDEEPAPSAEIPDWLTEFEVAEPADEAMAEAALEEKPEPSPIEEPLPEAEAPDWLKDVEEGPAQEEPAIGEVIEEVPEPSAAEDARLQAEVADRLDQVSETPMAGDVIPEEIVEEVQEPSMEDEPPPTTEVPDWLQEMAEAPAKEIPSEPTSEEAISPPPEEELTKEPDPVDWTRDVEEAVDEIEPVSEEIPVSAEIEETPPPEEALDWLREIEGIEEETPVISEEIPEETFEPAPIEEPISAEEEILIEEETLDWLQEEAREEVSTVEATEEQVPEWTEEIEPSPEQELVLPSEEIDAEVEPVQEEVILPEAEAESEWRPEFAEREMEEPETPEPIEEPDVEPPKADLEESFDWLQETAQEVASEPGIEVQPDEPIYTTEEVEEFTESIEDALDDDEVFSFLDGLAARETEREGEVPPSEVESFEPTSIEEAPEEKLIEEHEIPEELDESLMWLEQLAGEEPVEDFTPPVFVEEDEDELEAEVPEWLEEVAEKPEVTPGEETPIDKEDVAEEIPAEPAPSISELSSMETIISKPPVEERTTPERPETDVPEEKTEEAEPLVSPAEEGEELVWDVISDEEIPAPSTTEPQIPAEEEIPPTEVPEAEPPGAVEEAPLLDKAEPTEATPVDQLNKARSELQRGAIEEALANYANLIQDKLELESVIQDLRDAIAKTPREPMLWQTLGDALMKAGRLSDAIDAYRRGMEAV